jgi:hypothetical protein
VRVSPLSPSPATLSKKVAHRKPVGATETKTRHLGTGRKTAMSKYRVQVMVGVDVEAHSDGEAISEAIQKVRGIVGDDPTEPLPKEAWVTGIALADATHAGSSVSGLMVFRQSE